MRWQNVGLTYVSRQVPPSASSCFHSAVTLSQLATCSAPNWVNVILQHSQKKKNLMTSCKEMQFFTLYPLENIAPISAVSFLFKSKICQLKQLTNLRIRWVGVGPKYSVHIDSANDKWMLCGTSSWLTSPNWVLGQSNESMTHAPSVDHWSGSLILYASQLALYSSRCLLFALINLAKNPPLLD